MACKKLALITAVLLISSCSSMSNIFKSDKEKAIAPSPLVAIKNPIQIKKLWSISVGAGEDTLGVRQKPAVDSDTVFAADSGNNLLAVDKNTGKIKWKAHPNKEAANGGWTFWKKATKPFALTGGPAVGAGVVAVGGRNGEVFAFNAQNGALLWKTMVSSSVISAPLVTSDAVVVRANDGKVSSLDLSTGEKKWQFERGLPSLSVRGNAAPVSGSGFIYLGYEDGTLIAVSAHDGQRAWEQLIAKPDGRTELDRMADIDGEIQVGDREVFANSYHGSTMAVAGNTGQPIWVRDIGGYAGINLLSDRITLSDTQGNVWALDRAGGTDIWKQSALVRRGLSTPVTQGTYTVVADLEGYAHWLSVDSGEIKGRVKLSSGVRGTPVVSDDGIVFIQSTNGKLAAFSLVP